ncbi:hypothetical protein RJT34_23154 [Clitoria ternatea]|uniref:Uncharacterized protein n=1 Tax=Clitoria ternatea TaxID=43366 RepID=A0AAN9FKL4_CLITE
MNGADLFTAKASFWVLIPYRKKSERHAVCATGPTTEAWWGVLFPIPPPPPTNYYYCFNVFFSIEYEAIPWQRKKKQKPIKFTSPSSSSSSTTTTTQHRLCPQNLLVILRGALSHIQTADLFCFLHKISDVLEGRGCFMVIELS